MSEVAGYGTWVSPISADDVVAGVLGIIEVAYDQGQLYWVELRPSEGGQQVLVCRDGGGDIDDLTSAPMSARTRVHEYGGGAVTASDGRVVFSNDTDQRLHLITGDGAVPVTTEPDRPASVRYADGRFLDHEHLVCVRETHPAEGEPVNELVRVDVGTGEETLLATGRDFYAAPRPSGDGRLAWLEWDHPNMPWDGTELKVATVTDSGLGEIEVVAGGVEESVFQPEWAEDGSLVFSSDRTGWWNLYRWNGHETSALHRMEADFGSPLWQFGATAFGFLSGGRILAGNWKNGVHHLAVIRPEGTFQPVKDDEHTAHLRLVTDGDHTAWFVGAGPAVPARLVELDVDKGSRTVVRTNPMPVDPAYVSPARPISFPTGEGESAHAIFYPPANPAFIAPEGELPPLIVKVHGGPTSQEFPALRASLLYWTTRGFAVVDVNYRGSTGYGREYRNKLRGEWGVVDVQDCMAAARHLTTTSEVDGERLVITGGSAGGFTTLAALAFGETFRAGASYYGVANLGLLAAHTHKFESRYLDGLVDPADMKERSPLFSAHAIDVPVILFQGLEDKVVPPEQAQMIADALAANGVPHAHITYEGEDHGFRQAENIVHSLETELVFYGEVFGFTPAGDLPQVDLVGHSPNVRRHTPTE